MHEEKSESTRSMSQKIGLALGAALIFNHHPVF
jgi:hypothetical protein